MNRKQFVRNSIVATALYPFLNVLQSCATKSAKQNRIFVLIQLTGGNDGLNTLIPLDNYKNIIAARPNLFIPENKILSLKGTAATGLHPALAGIKDMYDNNLIGFVQGVGYPNQNYSHFRSSDIWMTGAASSQFLYTGWMARFLETRYKNYPEGFPNAMQTDPPAIKIGDSGTFVFQGEEMDMSIVIDPASTGFDPIQTGSSAASSTGFAAQEVQTIREILVQTDKYSGVIKKALSTSFVHSNLYPKPGENPLADQLKMAAKLINGGLQTSIYHVDLKGFDTHVTQADASDTTKGVHADLLKKLSQAITCFWDDMNKMGRQDDVTGMTFSEFGRRIMSNAGLGTDHGASQPLIFFGSGINAGIIGHNPVIPDKVTGTDNLEMQYDFRAVYSAIIKNRMNGSDKELKNTLPGNFSEIQIFE